MNSKPNGSVTVRVAATSANLGGGFDCMGLALGMYHTVTASFADITDIKTDAHAPADKRNLIYVAMNKVFERFGKKNANVKIVSHSDIPQASGLGSSAACIVAGVTAANALLGSPLSAAQMISLCTDIDGHPDNVVPAITGGVAAACRLDDGSVEYISCVPAKNIVCAVATPSFPLSTEKARKALPGTYSRADCVYSLSHAVVTFAALSAGNVEKLRAVGDRLHQPYRIPLIPGYADVCKAFTDAGAVSCCISGAGPSVLAFFDKPPAVSLPSGWTLRVPGIDVSPVKVTFN